MPQVKGMLVGAPLPSSSSKHEAEKTIIECKHPEYAMKARGNRTRAWWTCNMCHGRWERFNKEDAPVLPPESSVSDLKKAHYSRHAPLVPSSDTILTFGKHRGSTIRFVGTTYPKYCQWLLRTAKEQPEATTEVKQAALCPERDGHPAGGGGGGGASSCPLGASAEFGSSFRRHGPPLLGRVGHGHDGGGDPGSCAPSGCPGSSADPLGLVSVLLTSEQIPSALHDHLPSDLQGGYVAHYLLNAPRCMKYLHNRYRPEQSILGRCRVQLGKVGDQWQPSQAWSTAPEQLRFYELPNWFAEHAAEDEDHYHSLSRKDRVHLIKNIENLDPDTFAVDVTEVYSPVRMANPALCKKQGLVPGSSLDLRTGWNFGLRNHRENAIRLVDSEDPELLVLSPMCDQFSQMNRINEARRDPQRRQAAWDTAIMHFRFAVRLCSLRHQRGKKFLLEQPWLAESWRERDCVKLQQEPGVRWVHGPQCAFGLQVSPDGRLSRKETGWLTNCDEIADALVKPCTCSPGGHATLESGLAKKAQTYPRRLCEAVLKALRKYLDRRDAPNTSMPDIQAFPEVVEPMESIPEMEPYFPGRRVPEQDENLDDGDGLDVARFEPTESPQPYSTGFVPTKEQIADIQMAHDNAGHPENVKFARYLRLGGTRRDVCNWIRANFQCAACASAAQPKSVRPAGIPRSYRANYVVGLDCIDIPGANDGPAEPWLNSLCWDTAFQSVDRLPRLEVEDPEMTPLQCKTSLNVWVCFATNWIKFFGPPEILVTDQGTEFLGLDFMERAAASGITQLPINSKAPWENGRTENAGFHWKLCMAKAILNDPPRSDGEHLALAAQVTASRNRCINRSGFSPIQRLLGFSPRLPSSLLSDDPIDSSLLSQDPLADFQRSEELRRAATVAVAQSDAREGLARLSRAKHRMDLNCQNGDLVYAWRPKVTHGGKWVGPGVVIMAAGSTVWVSMRGAPWKCARSQLRRASSDEAMGVEIVNKHLWQLREALTRRSHRRGFIDVESEGPPDESAYHPEEKDDVPTATVDGETETITRTESTAPAAPSQANTALPSESAETPRSTKSVSSAPSEPDPKRPRLDATETIDIPGLIAQYPDAGSATYRVLFVPTRSNFLFYERCPTPSVRAWWGCS